MDNVLSEEEIKALFSAMSSNDWSLEDQSADDGLNTDPPLNTTTSRASSPAGERITELCEPIYFHLSGEIRGSNIRMQDLLRMSVGDIITLKGRIGDPMVLCVAGVPKFTGKILQRRGKKVFSITGRTSG